MASDALFLDNEAATEAFGARLAAAAGGLNLVTLSGDLGTGKTTLIRGLLRALGHGGAVKSPTYTIVEPYEFDGRQVMHFDLYRLEDPEELEYLGFRDYLTGDTLCLIEWPERGGGFLPVADLALSLAVEQGGRRVEWRAGSEAGQAAAGELAEDQKT